MNHLSRMGKAHSISTAVRDDDGACGFVGFVARPISLRLQEHLYPTREASIGLLQPTKRVVVTGRRDLCPHGGHNLQAIAFHIVLVAQDCPLSPCSKFSCLVVRPGPEKGTRLSR